MEELEFVFQEEDETMDISIVIADITEEELARLNENAEITLRAADEPRRLGLARRAEEAPLARARPRRAR